MKKNENYGTRNVTLERKLIESKPKTITWYDIVVAGLKTLLSGQRKPKPKEQKRG